MSVRVAYEFKRPGGSRESSWLEDFCDDVRTATGEIGDLNYAEEGVRYRHFADDEGPASFLGDDSSGTASAVPAQAFLPIPGAAAVILPGPFTVRPGERLRVRTSVDFPTVILGPVYGIPGGTTVQLRLTYNIDTVATPDAFSEVRTTTSVAEPESTGLTTFSTFYNSTGTAVTIENIEPELACSGLVRVSNTRVEADVFRKV
jgi:hypothetical protein